MAKHENPLMRPVDLANFVEIQDYFLVEDEYDFVPLDPNCGEVDSEGFDAEFTKDNFTEVILR
jgi:hypothetical protein